MSLVNDALKRARHEAALREAREKGLPDPLPLAYGATRRGRRLGTPAMALALVAAMAAGVLGAAWFLRDGRESAAAPAPATAAPPSPGAAAASLPPAPVALAPPAVTAEAAAPRRSAEESPTLDREARPATSAPAPAANPTAAPPVETPASPAALAAVAPAVTHARPRLENGRRYLRRIELPDGGAIELGGIAYSDSAPLAYLNGRMMGVGERLENFTVAAIERTRVVLVGGAAGEITLYLDLK